MTTLEGPLAELIHKRRSQNRNITVNIVSQSSELGVGKTTLAVLLADYIDASYNGFSADKAAQSPDEAVRLYKDLPKRSALMLDDAGVLIDARRSMSGAVKDFTHYLQTMRYREIHTIITAPSIAYVDKRARELSDIIIRVFRRGVAEAYRVKQNFEGDLRERHLQTLEWGPIKEDDGEIHRIYRRIEEQKADRMEGRIEEKEDTEEVPDKVVNEIRDNMVKNLSDADVSHKKLAEAMGLSEPRISQIVNKD